MKKKVTIALNTLDSATWEDYEVEDLVDFLMTTFPTWPETAKLYHKQVAVNCDVTPICEADIKKLDKMEGPFFVMVYPAGPISTLSVISSIISILAVFLAPKPKIPNTSQRNRQTTSPNNELSERKNQPRLNGRIPDIYGQVRSTPDLIQVPYTSYINHEEVEYAYMCIGRGAYDISDVRDDTTAISAINGAAIEVFAPYTSPNFGTPQLTIGTSITEPLWSAYRSSAVNGQALRAPNALNVVGSSSIRFVAPNKIQVDSSTGIDFTRIFAAGDLLNISNANYTGPTDVPPPATTTVNLNGTGYTIATVSSTEMTLTSPNLIASDWNNLGLFVADMTAYISATLESVGDRWVGPFVINNPDMSQVFLNFVAVNGLYKDNGTNQLQMDVALEVAITPVDAVGTPTGTPELFTTTVIGSATTTGTRAVTLKCNPTFNGRMSVRVRRTTDTDLSYSGTVVDEVKWKDMFGMIEVLDADFGNVTTVQAVTFATAGALSIKERKLNMLVTRKLPQRISGSTFTSTLHPTQNAADIISAIALDPYIGNRTAAEVDFDNIYDTVQEVIDYFGTDVAAQFNYTFDSDNISFEETVIAIAEAIHCQAYRRGNLLKLTLEKETDTSTLIFNHRNKLPNSESRQISFGYVNDNDGVSYDYVDPSDDAIVTYYIPQDQSAVNPKKVESIGVRGKLQAYFHANRLWNKIRYQRIATEFTATAEADILLKQDRVLVADNTRQGTQDGEVESQDGLELTLSQAVTFEIGQTYAIFLQHIDATVQSIAITAGSAPNKVLLAAPPAIPLSLNSDNYARATYIIVGSDDSRERAFLIEEKNPQDNFTFNIRALNYDDRYYANDSDYTNGVVDINGNLI